MSKVAQSGKARAGFDIFRLLLLCFTKKICPSLGKFADGSSPNPTSVLQYYCNEVDVVHRSENGWKYEADVSSARFGRARHPSRPHLGYMDLSSLIEKHFVLQTDVYAAFLDTRV